MVAIGDPFFEFDNEILTLYVSNPHVNWCLISVASRHLRLCVTLQGRVVVKDV